MFDLAAHMYTDSEHTPELAQALRSRLDATEQLVSAFVQLSGKSRVDPGQKHAYSECQKAQTEVRGLSSDLGFPQTCIYSVRLYVQN
jgi:E3 ubiquitin-protein ligase BRE1